MDNPTVPEWPTSDRAREIIEGYEAWDPEKESVSELAARLGVSRQRLYEVLSNHNITPKSRRRRSRDGSRRRTATSVTEELMDEMSQTVLEYLLQQLVEAREELKEYRKRYGPLD